ncbi:MAG: diguanylate cyclase, partial [Pseudomonadota bacterium]
HRLAVVIKHHAVFIVCLLMTSIAQGEGTHQTVIVVEDPLVYDESGHIQGFLVDLVSALSNQTGEEFKKRAVDTEQEALNLLNPAKRQEADLGIGISRKAAQQIGLAVSEQRLITLWQTFYTHSQSGILTLDDFSGKTIAVQRRYANQLLKFCKDYGLNCKSEPYNRQADILAALATGQADIGLVTNLYGARYAKDSLRRVGPTFSPQGLYVVAPVGAQSEAVLKEIDGKLAQWKHDLKSPYHEALNRWTTPIHPVSIQSVWQNYLPWLVALAIGGIALIAILLVMLRGRLLGREINALQKDFDFLKQSEWRYRDLVESLPYGLQETDTLGRIIFTNRAEHQMRRFSDGELLGKSVVDMLASEEEKEKMHTFYLTTSKEQPKPESYQNTILRKDGETAEIRVEWDYKRDPQGEVVGFLSVLTDVTELRETRKRVKNLQSEAQKMVERRNNELLEVYNELLITATVFESTTEAIMVTDADFRIESINPSFVNITGYFREEVTSKTPDMLVSQKHDVDFYSKLFNYLHKNHRWQGEAWNQRKNGEVYPVHISINAVIDAYGELSHYVALLSDITERKQKERLIWRQANFDALTGLPNRNLFQQRLGQAVERAGQNSDTAALMFIDLDKFKEVNDTLGHDAGDELLKAVAKELLACVGNNDTVARMGGDEFTVIMPRITDAEQAAQVASAILKRLCTPFKLTADEVNISGSIGIVVYPEDGDNMIELLKNADIAMYHIKESGRNGYCFFSSEDIVS